MSHNQISDSWERGSAYDQYVGRWSRQLAPLFLSWLRLPVMADGSISLTARAWAARATVAK